MQLRSLETLWFIISRNSPFHFKIYFFGNSVTLVFFIHTQSYRITLDFYPIYYGNLFPEELSGTAKRFRKHKLGNTFVYPSCK